MIELHFHRELYDGFAIDEASKVYGAFAAFELVTEPEGYVVRLTAAPGDQAVDEPTLAAEFATYALGLTVVAMGDPERVPQTPPAADAPPAPQSQEMP